MSRSESATIARRAGTVAGFTLGSRVLGYLRDAVLAHLFGAGLAHDAYVVALTIPNVLRRLVAEGALMIAFVPLASQEKEQGGIPAMRRFTAAVLGALLPLLLVLVGLGMAFPDLWVALFAPGFDAARAAIATDLTRIMMPFVLFVSLLAVAGGALNTVGVFAPTAAAPMFLNLAIISAALGARHLFAVPMHSVGWGVVAGGILGLLLQLPFLRRHRLLVRPRWQLSHPSLIQLGRRMIPAVYGAGVYQLNVIIIRAIASSFPAGEVSCYFVATRLEEFALGVFAVSVSIAALPTLSEHAARGDEMALRATFRRAIRLTNFITIPSTVGLLLLARPIVGALFVHGRFSPEAGELTAGLLVILAIGLVPIGAVRIVVPTYYALGDTKTPVYAAVASTVTTAAGGWALGAYCGFGIGGLTVAIILAAAAQLMVLLFFLGRRIRAAVERGTAARRLESVSTPSSSLLAHGGRCLAAILPPAAGATLVAEQRNWFAGDNVMAAFELGLLVVGVVLAYFALARLLRIEEADMIVRAIRRRLPWRA